MILNGDCRTVLAGFPENHFDAIVTDPPYGLSFMGKDWDFGVPGIAFWEEILRVAKPGCHLLAFGGTRTHHRLMTAIEDAGWEIRDCLMWLYGQGFPKSMDVSKAIDKAAGAEREVIGIITEGRAATPRKDIRGGRMHAASGGDVRGYLGNTITAPATDAAKQWSGYGTALKPAWEPIILARKPLSGTVAATVLEFGCGALNIDASRIGTESKGWNRNSRASGLPGDERDCSAAGMFAPRGREGEATANKRYTEEGSTDFAATPGPRGGDVKGRFPANVILDEAAGAVLDEQSGQTTSTANVRHCSAKPISAAKGREYERDGTGYSDTGGASRFFYCAKASKKDRGAGNIHPTVKPQSLMQYLVKLVTPPNGLVLDPFAGSGSTIVAAEALGFRGLGIELNPEYATIAEKRAA